LPHNFKNCPFELRKFIEKQYAVMPQGNLSGLRESASSNQGDI
jgi:hypothetical protein